MDDKIKTALALLALAAAAVVTINLLKEKPEPAYGPGTLIRLHVIANSDSAFDQELKRKVRDKIILNMASEFMEAENINSARTVARANLVRIRKIAAGEIKAVGKDYPVAVELDRFAFPTKHYGPFILPAGDYEAVRVTIGSGGGANWWCVLFPPLCFVDMSKAAAVSQPENSEKGSSAAGQNAAPPLPPAAGKGKTPGETYPKIEYRFKLLDMFKKFNS